VRTALSEPRADPAARSRTGGTCVADARPERRHGARVVERHPRGAVYELVIYAAPELAGGGGVAQLQRVGAADLRVDPAVAELGDVEIGRAARDERAARQQW
jgi:hypothetical protein